MHCFGPGGGSSGKTGSHKTLEHNDFPDYVFAFHDADDIGPRMLARIAKHTGLKPEDL
nr:type II toxin-antitoxin system HicA family toxin [Methylococcus sp. Mc7]